MSLSTEEAVRETYRVALRETLKKDLKTPQEFERFVGIEREGAERFDAEKDAFREDYQLRLADAREVILREHNARTLDHPKPTWADDQLPSSEKVDLLARNRVQADHDKRLAAIRTDETDQYRSLRDECRARATREAHARDVRQDHAKEAFTTSNQLSPHEAKTRLSSPGRSGPSRS